jgi:hypothetical protein
MKTSFSAGIRSIGVLLSIVFLSSANPVDPSYYPFLSEIQVTDSLHWNVEVDQSHMPVVPCPCATDTFKLFCGQSSSTPPADSMRRPVIHEVFDANGIAVLTPQHFPGLKLKKGSYVFLQTRYSTYTYTTYTWSTQIPTYLTSQQSIVGGLYQYCGGCEPVLGYKVSYCPSIGIQNNKALGSITGHVRGADSQLLTNIRVNVTTNPASGTAPLDTTNGSGLFSFSSLDRCHTYYLRFTDTAGTLISDTTIGPLTIIMGGTITVEVVLKDGPITKISHPKNILRTEGSVRLLSPKIHGQIPMAFSGAFSGQGTIDLFSATGSLIRSIVFDCRGPGTYTVLWDGRNGLGRPVPAGTYVCRVTLDKEVRCKGFIAW